MLTGVFGNEVKLQSGETIVADETYVRESLMNPLAKIVAGYQPLMPTYQGQLSEDQIMQLIAYIRSLGKSASGDHAQAELATGSEG
jgi:cytochrome c oxidase subunit 2